MTMRSKQWYTRTSRLSNSFANNSIGRLRDRVWQQDHRSSGRWSQPRRLSRELGKGRKGFQRERNRRLRSLWFSSELARNTELQSESPTNTPAPVLSRECQSRRASKFQICLASLSPYGSEDLQGANHPIRCA